MTVRYRRRADPEPLAALEALLRLEPRLMEAKSGSGGWLPPKPEPPTAKTVRRWLEEALLAEGHPPQQAKALWQAMIETGLIVTSESGTSGQRRATIRLGDRAIQALGFKALSSLLSRQPRRGPGPAPGGDPRAGASEDAETAPYRPGEALVLDPVETLKRLLPRPIEALREDDLIQRTQSSGSAMATALLLDCSHSMVLSGKDRFTPAKRTVLALAHLIRARYPRDRLKIFCFHDSAEAVPLGQVPLLAVGPWHTNTAQGLRLARAFLKRAPEPNRQVLLVTDGKPSALTLENGEIYRNAWGLDPKIVRATLNEALALRRLGARVHIFLFAPGDASSDDDRLVGFARDLARAGGGQVHRVDPETLGPTLIASFLRHHAG